MATRRSPGFPPRLWIACSQSVLNAAARLVLSARKYDHITPLLRELHWLRVPERITFKLAVLVYRCLHGQAPRYLADELRLLTDIPSRQRLRSASSPALAVPLTHRRTICNRAFPAAASRVWNGLSSDVTTAPSLAVFRWRLKTELFGRSYGGNQ
jgi:hypothetical protein